MPCSGCLALHGVNPNLKKCIPGDLNINLYQNGSTLEKENKSIIKGTNKVSSKTNFVKILA